MPLAGLAGLRSPYQPRGSLPWYPPRPETGFSYFWFLVPSGLYYTFGAVRIILHFPPKNYGTFRA